MASAEQSTGGVQSNQHVRDYAMKTSIHWIPFLLSGLVGVSSLVHAQPPNVVVSDVSGNTAMGTDALKSQPTGTIGEFNNTAAGISALQANTSGYLNSAFGAGALESSNGTANTAVGAGSMVITTTGSDNTAIGALTLWHNTTGSGNTAAGINSLSDNTSGTYNTASGVNSLYSNTEGGSNVAAGYQALEFNTTGNNNTGTGASALQNNTVGRGNTASGFQALYSNTTGAFNTVSGTNALYNNNGGQNTAIGYEALFRNTSGQYNVAVGSGAGINVKGSNNIDIGNPGEASDGATAGSGVIRIGRQSPALQSSTYIAGIYDNSSVNGIAVVIDSNGQLGTVRSSERLKTAIAPMGLNTANLKQLRPVTFRYKADPRGTLRYGLIAEEVAKVYPELVVRDENGRIDGVRYDELAPMLLNEMQKESEGTASKLAAQSATIELQDAKIRDLRQQMVKLADLGAQMADMRAALAALQGRNQLVASR
jgi:Chaperone of endosialidase